MADVGAYQKELDALLNDLDSTAHDEDQIERWVDFVVAKGYGEHEIFDFVFNSVRQRRGKKDAEEFASRVRRRALWHGWAEK